MTFYCSRCWRKPCVCRPQCEALEIISDIAEGSTTVNSLPHIAKIARAALAVSSRERL